MAVAIRMKYIQGLFSVMCCLYLLKIAIIDKLEHRNLQQEARGVRRPDFSPLSQHSNQREKVDGHGNIDRINDRHKEENGNQRTDGEEKRMAKMSLPLNKTLLQEIRDQMVPQSAPNLASDTENLHRSQVGQSQFIDEASGGLRNGFFVECGAANGIYLSNSYFFERARNWTGLLVEGNTDYFEQIQKNKRSAYSMNACMSVTLEPSTVLFRNAGELGGIADTMDEGHIRRIRSGTSMDSPMKCYSLHSMLQAIGRMHVNYFSLDIEGPELDILKTIPFDEVVIDFLTVEYRTTNKNDSINKLNEIRNFMVDTGLYEQIAILTYKKPHIHVGDSMKDYEWNGLDVAFKRRGFPSVNSWN